MEEAHLLDFLGGTSERYSSGLSLSFRGRGEDNWVKRAHSAAEAGTEGRQHEETPFESPELPLPTSEEHRQTGQKGQFVFGLNSRRKLEASVAKGKEKEENREAGRATLPKLPQEQAGRGSDKMWRAQLPQEEEDGLSSPEITSDTEEGLQMAEAWIQARRQFRTELESLGDIEKWLAQKPSLSNQEKRCWQRIKARRADRRAAVKSAVTDSLDRSPPKSSQPRKKGTIPLICAPYPQALVTLHSLLHKQKLRMVDVFRKAGMDGRKIKRADFVTVIKETKVPISDRDLEDVVIFLTSPKPGNFISPEDLVDCQKQWLEMKKGQSQETKTGVEAQFQKATCRPATDPPSAGDTARQMKPHAPTKPERKLIHLDVPPVNAEPERRHLSCDEMEEIGKLLRERRRWEKNKDSPIERKEKCRMVRSGDGPVDEHCLPSTVEADLGELVDRYRRNAVRSYLKSSRLCKERDVHITDPTLQKALLHPGDKIIKEGEDIRKIRQPGGYYSAGRADAPSPGSTSRPGTASGSQAKEMENRFVQRGLKISPLLLPPLCITPLCSVPTVSEAVPRYWSEPLGRCKGAASESEEVDPLLSYTATPVFYLSHCVAVVPLNTLWCLAGASQTSIFRGISCKSQVTITSGQVISWTSYAFTFLKSSMTGHTPCSAMFIQPGPPTMASKALTAASSSASQDTRPLEALPSRRPVPPEALLQAAGDVCTAL
ncbi:uncharacterized protein LOC142420749 [Mycteria americana]|uniref:uncharacterized protein LOC142420748 n=1 Tax=Mycteria americana TaxID=33587 RepID=UPI003F5807DA